MSQGSIESKLRELNKQPGHRYNPPASAERVDELEFVIGCSLPEDYRNFLLSYADGGSNGYDWLVSTEEQLRLYIEQDKNSRIRKPFPFSLEHAMAFEAGEERTLELSQEVWHGREFGPSGLDGTLVIQHSGYSGSAYLIVRGDLFGRVCFTGDRIAGIYPAASFSEWLLSDEWSYSSE